MAGNPSSRPMSLPSDCWLNILDMLPFEDIRSLLFVSKSCSGLALPFLYRRISFNWNPIPVRKILLLLHGVLQQPERISHIQHVSFLSHTKVDSLDPWEPPSFQTDPKEELHDFQDVLRHSQAIIEDNQFPDPEVWLQALDNGHPYAYASIFLSQLHNLRSLELDYSFIWQSGFPGLMLRHALFSPTQNTLSKFTHLTEVDYGGNVRRATIFDDYPELVEEEGYPLVNTDQFPAWFYLPSLTSLTIWLRTKESLEMPGLQPDLTNLQKLILPRATINEDQVPALLALTPNLKTLHLGMTYHYGNEVIFENGPAIVQGLESVCKTVTTLSLRVEYYPPSVNVLDLYRGERDLTKPFYGLWKQFPSLRAVELPIQLLVGWDTRPWANLASALPETVEQLWLRNDYEPWDENGWHEGEVLNLVGSNAGKLRMYLPCLRRVVVRKWRMFWDTPEIENSREAARSAFEAEGIELVIVADGFATGLWAEEEPCI